MTIKNVAIVGANGALGPAILSQLLACPDFVVTVLSRALSKSTYSSSIRVAHFPDHPSTEELAEVLHGQDALVVATSGSESQLQIKLADACVKAGVKRFIPADFGSCDSSSPQVLALMDLYRAKMAVREHLQQLASSSSLTWTSLVCGHFLDFDLRLLQLDLEQRKVRIFDGGDIKWSTTTIGTVGKAVVRILQKEDETRNRMLYIQGMCVTQNEVLKALETATGQSWQVEHASSEEYIREVKAEVDKDPNNAGAREDLVSVVGIIDSYWEEKEDFANSLLEIQPENLYDEVKRIVSRETR